MQDLGDGTAGCGIAVTGSLGSQAFMELPAAGGLHEALEELRRRNAELAEAVAARDAFIAVAAHELRNPMTPMIGQVDLLLNGVRAGKFSPEQVEQRLERILRIMDHYLKRATTLLDVSRITSGKLKLDPAPCDLAELAREVVATFAWAAGHAGSLLGIDAPASLSGTWDRLAMEQVLDNLVSNAIKYGAGRPVAVCVEDAGGDVRIRVRDHGPGISPSDRARIFGRFERAVGRGERHGGFGIGLWVVGQLVEAMGGTIAVDDAQGGGTAFDVTVPRHVTAVRP
jgi:signal transduction histidine kinase